LKAFKPLTEGGELQIRMVTTYKKAKKSKLWDNPKKREKLESLLAEMEAPPLSYLQWFRGATAFALVSVVFQIERAMNLGRF